MSIFERLRAWWQAPLLAEVEAMRAVQRADHLALMAFLQELSTTMTKQNEAMATLLVALGDGRADVCQRIDTVSHDAKAQHEVVIWRLAHLLSKTLGGSSEEWARPVQRLPKVFSYTERQ